MMGNPKRELYSRRSAVRWSSVRVGAACLLAHPVRVRRVLVERVEEGVPQCGGGVFEGGHIDVFGGLLEGGFPGVQEVLGFGGVVRGGGDFDLLGLGPGGDGDVEGFLGGGSLAGGAQQVDGADGVGGGERFERCGHGVSPSAAAFVGEEFRWRSRVLIAGLPAELDELCGAGAAAGLGAV